MLKGIAFISILSLSAWILPLGAFIKPSQERAACGGKRAFHMCSVIQSQGQGPATTQWTAPSPSSGQLPASASDDGLFWTLTAGHAEADSPTMSFLSAAIPVLSGRFAASIDHPPEFSPFF